MRTYPIPFNEEARLRAIYAVPGLSNDNAALFDAICEATRKLLGVPVAHISVVEDDTQWYKSVVGMDLSRMPKDNSFCAHTIMSDKPMVVPDLSKDPRFVDHPMVAEGGPQARFYAGVPLVLASGQRFGSLCGLDLTAHAAPSATQIAILQDLGRAVVAALESVPPKEPELTEDTAAKSMFITLIGHELRTPLTILFGTLSLLEAKGEVHQMLLTSARKSAQHIMKLVDTIIAFSNAATGELKLNERRCEIGELLADVAALRLPGKDGVIKSITVAEGSLVRHMHIDPEQIQLAVSALMLNAVIHGGDNITVGIRHDAQSNIELWVSDDGRLGDHVELDQLYQPFVVGGDLETRDTKGGLGLGLPLTRKLVELHGGEFEVRPEDDRTVAVIRLPAWRAEGLV